MAAPIQTGDMSLDRLGLHVHWLLRLAFTGVFLYMGIDKFMGGGIAEFAAATHLPGAVATLVALAEIAAGVLVFAGAFAGGWVTRLFLAVYMLVRGNEM